jgi:predicted phosphoadenosine phosphosulfate sulfurtransferase
MPRKTRDHYIIRFKKFISGWNDRGYEHIPDEAPIELENCQWVPSWRRLCKVILRNDYWCKSLGQTQPKSEAYGKFLAIRDRKKQEGGMKGKVEKIEMKQTEEQSELFN